MSSEAVKNPGHVEVSAGLKMFFYFLAGVGAAAFLYALKTDPARAWSSYLTGHFYFLSLAVGGLFFVAVQFATGAMWSAPIRRIAESFTAYLPIALVTGAILYFGIHDLYHWSHPDVVKGDPVLEGKASYLSVGFFMIRNLLSIALWWAFARGIVGNSIAQDKNGAFEWTVKNRKLAPGFLILFALTYTMASFDLLMSLDPHWFSTIFGVYCFAGLFYSTLALLCILTARLYANGTLNGIVNENHFHDIGKFMFAFTVFWAYIGFSQFILIWYANLPEETGYFLKRMNSGWMGVSIFLMFGKFFAPFFVLLPRAAKRNPVLLTGVAAFMMVAQWVDVIWMVQPEFVGSAAGPRLGLTEVGIFLGFTGLFGSAVSRFMGRHNAVAIGDPRLAESVHHHHQ